VSTTIEADDLILDPDQFVEVGSNHRVKPLNGEEVLAVSFILDQVPNYFLIISKTDQTKYSKRDSNVSLSDLLAKTETNENVDDDYDEDHIETVFKILCLTPNRVDKAEDNQTTDPNWQSSFGENIFKTEEEKQESAAESTLENVVVPGFGSLKVTTQGTNAFEYSAAERIDHEDTLLQTKIDEDKKAPDEK
jgi:hypothetical protein